MLYDEELMLVDLVNLLQSKLNDEITAINTEKNDGAEMALATIPNDKYVFQTLDDSMLNYKGFFLMYALENPGTIQEASIGNAIENGQFTIQIATFDQGLKNRSTLIKKLLRYRRALRSLILNNPDVFRGYGKAYLASLRPNAFAFGNVVVLTCGVDLKASITAI